MRNRQSDVAKLWSPSGLACVPLCTRMNQGPQHNRAPPLLPHTADDSSGVEQDFSEMCDIEVHALEYGCLTSPQNRMPCLEDRERLISVTCSHQCNELEVGAQAEGLQKRKRE